MDKKIKSRTPILIIATLSLYRAHHSKSFSEGSSVRMIDYCPNDTQYVTSKANATISVLGNPDTAAHIRASFRSRRHGPEHDLVEQFLETCSIQVPRGCRATIFREPRIESGFPDLVVVVWHAVTTEEWSESRLALTNDDIRLMHYLVQSRSTSEEDIGFLFGKRWRNSIERLEVACMARKTRKRSWAARPLSKVFAARHIVAVEAKVSAWQEALDQAYLNTWFASASFVMVPRVPKRSQLQPKANALGVRIHEVGTSVFDTRTLPTQQRPLSYASWLFNEWAWRATQSHKGMGKL